MQHAAKRVRTDEPDFSALPDITWDPASFNHEFDEGSEEWYDALMDHAETPHWELFDEFGNYCKQQAAVAEENFVGAVLDGGLTVDSYVWYVNQVDLSKRQPEARHVKPREHDWETLRHFFSWASVKSVEKILQAMMQLGRLSNAVHLKEHCHSPNPTLKVHHHQEPVATDYVYANVPAVDDGSMGAQIFVGMDSEVCDTQGLKSPKQFVNLLEDNIQKCGAWTSWSAIECKRRLVSMNKTSFKPSSFHHGKVNHTSSSKTWLSTSTRCLGGTLIPHLVVPVHLQTLGSYVFFTSASC